MKSLLLTALMTALLSAAAPAVAGPGVVSGEVVITIKISGMT